MIYLIDDKTKRQKEDYEFTADRLNLLGDKLECITKLSELEAKSEEIFQPGNCVLYHESFLDKSSISDEALKRRLKLEEFAGSNGSFLLVFFSGSKASRVHEGNVAYMPVATMYQNLEIFVNRYSGRDEELKFLLFGVNTDIEEKLIQLREETLIQAQTAVVKKTDKSSLLFRPSKGHLFQPLEGAEEVTIRSDVSDEKLSELILKHLADNKYDAIFIPICFGKVLSDINGLRLACHVRCTQTINQTSSIYIYSFLSETDILHSDYFDVLKLKNIKLIDYNVEAIGHAAQKNSVEMTAAELRTDLRKINLKVPDNYEDDHSIANEWAIFRWSNLIGSTDAAILKIDDRVHSNLYFKYLRTIHSADTISKMDSSELQIEGSEGTKVLYIDDEAEKGWFEIFSTILCDNNDFDLQYLDQELDSLSREEIVDLGLRTVKEENIDIVILDYRLHPDDFGESPRDHITGFLLLKAIKDYNPGIQVIVFSATNKVWNLLAIQHAGADGFIIKESPANSIDQSFTENTITTFVETLDQANKGRFLKGVWSDLKQISSLVVGSSYNIEVAFQMMKKSLQESKYLNYAYLQLFLIIEEFIKLEDVFERDDNGSSYVVTPNQRYLVFDFQKSVSGQKLYKSAIMFSEGNFKLKKGNISTRRLDTNTIVSALMMLRYGMVTSGEMNWTKIYSVRNRKAAHPESGIVSVREVEMLIRFLRFILDPTNINESNRGHALVEPSFEDKMAQLKQKFG